MTGVIFVVFPCFFFFVFLNSSKLNSSPPLTLQSLLCVSTCWWTGKPPSFQLTRYYFVVPLAFHPSTHPPQCLFVCLPLALFIASEFRPDILHLWGGCFFSFLFFLLCEHCLCVPLHIHLCFGPIFINYLSCILFIDERRGRPSQTATSKSALGKKKMIIIVGWKSGLLCYLF